MGGTVDDTELVRGLVFDKGAKKTAGGPTRIADAKIGLVQFCLSAPKVLLQNIAVLTCCFCFPLVECCFSCAMTLSVFL